MYKSPSQPSPQEEAVELLREIWKECCINEVGLSEEVYERLKTMFNAAHLPNEETNG